MFKYGQKLIFLNKPQINISVPSTGRMWLVSGSAFFCIFQSSMSDGGRSLGIAVTAICTAVMVEFLLTWRKHGADKIKDGSSIATGLILAMMLPNYLHPIYAALGSAFAITVIKFCFGGLGSNWLNPALGGWLFVRFSWPTAFFNALADYVPSVSEMAFISEISAIDKSVTEFFNNSIFSIAKVQLPSGYIDLLFNNNPGIITDRGLFALLIGTIFITAIGINRGWIPLVFLGIYGFLIRFAGDIDILWNGDVLYGLFSGGTVVVAFILAADPSSGAKLKSGVLFSVILTAFFSWFFRYRCMEYFGGFIALAFVNCITPIIRLVEERIFLKRITSSKTKENLL